MIDTIESLPQGMIPCRNAPLCVTCADLRKPNSFGFVCGRCDGTGYELFLATLEGREQLAEGSDV